jgi:hypothetical protein
MMTKRKKFSKKQKVYGSLSLVLILIVVIIYIQRPTGEAFRVTERPVIGILDLTSDPQVIFEVLPGNIGDAVVVDILTASVPFSLRTVELTLTVTRLNEQLFGVRVEPRGNTLPGDRLAEDSLNADGDEVRIHLDAGDARPELKIELVNNQIIITNLHFLATAGFKVDLLSNRSFTEEMVRVNYGKIVRLNTSGRLEAIVNITGTEIESPEIILSILPAVYNVTNSVARWNILNTDREYPNSTVNMTWMAPASPLAGLLNVTMRIGNTQTYKYFRLAVGNLTYNLSETNYPAMSVVFVNGQDWNDDQTSLLNVRFRATTALQPFAAPCELPQNSLNALLTNPNVDRVYSFNADTQDALVSTMASRDPGLTEFESFKGYYVKLLNPEETIMNFPNCEMKTLQSAVSGFISPLGTVPENLPVLKQGWNLFALPGVIPQPLSDFVADEVFTIFGCSQGETICTRLSMTDLLDPGKPYWVYADSNFRGSSVYG